jgi:acetylornithine/N-succinyldiaminopimelate aminotransferase
MTSYIICLVKYDQLLHFTIEEENDMQKSTAELLEQAGRSILFTAIRPDIVMEKGQGMYLWDTDGKKYLDFIGGWAVNCLGHCPDVIADALSKQSSLLVNASPSFYNRQMIEFAKLLTDISCFDRVFFTSTGAEANEGAVKLARKYGSGSLGGAWEIITTINSFHGRTLAMMSATGKKHWEDLFKPKLPGFVHVPFNDIDAAEAAVNENTCAIMIEPVQGEGGVNLADEKYIEGLRRLCDEKGILLIFDEVQTGIGRTGEMFAYQHYGIEPDIMTLAKGIGGGFPLSAMLAKERLNIFDPGDQGGTYTGQPLAMAVGMAVVREVLERDLPGRAAIMGEYIIERLKGMSEKYPLRNIRGKGLLTAFDLPDPIGEKIVSACLDEGLIINSPRPSAIRLMPPLIVMKQHVDEMIDILSRVLDRIYPGDRQS